MLRLSNGPFYLCLFCPVLFIYFAFCGKTEVISESRLFRYQFNLIRVGTVKKKSEILGLVGVGPMPFSAPVGCFVISGLLGELKL